MPNGIEMFLSDVFGRFSFHYGFDLWFFVEVLNVVALVDYEKLLCCNQIVEQDYFLLMTLQSC